MPSLSKFGAVSSQAHFTNLCVYLSSIYIVPDPQIEAFKHEVGPGCWYSSKWMLLNFPEFS